MPGSGPAMGLTGQELKPKPAVTPQCEVSGGVTCTSTEGKAEGGKKEVPNLGISVV